MKKVTLMLVVSAMLAYSTSARGAWESLGIDASGKRIRRDCTWDGFSRLLDKNDPQPLLLRPLEFRCKFENFPNYELIIEQGTDQIFVQIVQTDYGTSQHVCKKDQLLGSLEFDLKRHLVRNSDQTPCERV